MGLWAKATEKKSPGIWAQHLENSAPPVPQAPPKGVAEFLAAQQQEVSNPTSPLDASPETQAALQGYGQGASFGYLPQLQSAAEPTLAKIYETATGTDVSPTEDYVTRRDQYAALQDKLRQTNPGNYYGGQLFGGLSSAGAIPTAALAEGTGWTAQTARALQAGMANRGLQNPGDVQGEVSPLQAGQRIENATNPMGLAVDTVIPAVGPAFGKLNAALKNQAERSAFKALGPYAKESINAFGKGKVNQIGRTALDTGIVGGMPKSYGSIASKTSALRDQAGEELGTVVGELGSNPEASKYALNRNEIADKLQAELGNSPNARDVKSAREYQDRIKEAINEFRNNGAPNQSRNVGSYNAPAIEGTATKEIKSHGNYATPAIKERQTVDPTYWSENKSQIAPGLPPSEIPISSNTNENFDWNTMKTNPISERPSIGASKINIAENPGQQLDWNTMTIKPKDNSIPLLEAELKKRDLSNYINDKRAYGADIPSPEEQVNIALRSELRKGVESGAENLAHDTGYDVGKFKNLKSKYGDLAEASAIANRREAKDFSNRLVSPSDYGVGAAGAAVGALSGGDASHILKHTALGAGLGLLNMGARKYGNQISAMSADQLAKLSAKLQQAAEITNQDPQKLMQLQMLLNAQRGK